MKTIHLHCDIEGALRHPEQLVGSMLVNGRPVQTVAEVRKYLNWCRDQGWRVLPMSEDCEGFSYETGCPGHVREE